MPRTVRTRGDRRRDSFDRRRREQDYLRWRRELVLRQAEPLEITPPR